jgi:hypothetical protein
MARIEISKSYSSPSHLVSDQQIVLPVVLYPVVNPRTGDDEDGRDRALSSFEQCIEGMN